MNLVQRMRTLTALFIVAGGLIATADVAAQSYRFQVERMQLEVHLLDTSAARLDYTIKFKNMPGAHAIDIVDVGLPHNDYSIGNMSASVDGRPVRAIRRSEYINIGVECHLGGMAIRQGNSGEFKFSCVMPNMVYADTTDGEYASFQIRPTWFDADLQVGTTDLEVAIHLPPGVKPEEIRYQREDERYQLIAESGQEEDAERSVYWRAPEMRLSSANPKFSVSFPKRVMKRVVEKSKFEMFVEWFAGNKSVYTISAALLFLTFVLFYYRFSGGTGCVLFFLGLGATFFAIVIPVLHLCAWPTLLGMLGLNEWYLSRRKPSTYLPAMATVEGGGIKRGLTAPQAACLLEEPLGKVMTMVVFGLLKKRIVRLVSENPPTVEVEKKYIVPRKRRREIAAKEGVVIMDYEHAFIDMLQEHRGPVEKCDLNGALGGLVKSTVKRMQGFDRERTREYYRRIVKRAWKDAGSIGEIKKRDEVVDRNFEWMMMEEDWRDLFERWRRRGYTYYPRWSRPVVVIRDSRGGGGGGGGGVSWPSGGGGGGSSAPAPSGGAGSTPTFSEVAGSFIGWAENTTGRMASAIDSGKMGIPAKTSTVDLSGLDKATGEFFDAIAEASKNSGGGGGGGGGCACACAGCACACACAGGGR